MNPLTVAITAKRYANGHCAIQDLHFAVRPGELVAIVGPSGAGKTTLLHILSGLDRDYGGQVQGVPHERLGFMFQEPRLMPWLSVAQNLALVAPELPDAQLQQALAQVGLQGCAPLFPGQLSGGMQRRVALLRACLQAPQLLLMDEPFQALDAPTAEQLRAYVLAHWQATQATVLLVTHNLHEALALADRVLFLSGSPSRLALDYAVDLPRPRAPEAVQQCAQALLQAHPDLLRGQTGSAAGPAAEIGPGAALQPTA